MPRKIVVIGGGLSAKHTVEDLLKKGKDVEVTIIQANPFVEWPLAMTICMVKPELHHNALSTDAAKFQVAHPKVTYKYGIAASVDTASKQVRLAGCDETVPYDALVVATGFKIPAVYPRMGVTLEVRKAEIQQIGNAIKKASNVVVAGGGPVGLELAGGIRCKYPDKKVMLVCRGGVLPQWPEQQRQKAEAQLKKMSIEVLTASGDCPKEYSLQPGRLEVGVTDVAYDVYFPAFSQGPNTDFLQSSKGVLDEKGYVDVNVFLQSKACKEMFAVGVSNFKESFVNMAKLQSQWQGVAGNVLALLDGRPMKEHKEGVPWMMLPPMVTIGHGSLGYGYIDFGNLPGPLKCCCCCGLGGFPCCPPPCCWPCCTPCTCGYCCGSPEGSGPAAFAGKMAFKSSSFHFKGMGDAPAQQSM